MKFPRMIVEITYGNFIITKISYFVDAKKIKRSLRLIRWKKELLFEMDIYKGWK